MLDLTLTGVRVEWSKAYQRVCRWTEEVEILKEEMQRTPITLRKAAADWTERQHPIDETSDEHTEGANAYASRQAALYSRLATHFEEKWKDVLNEDMSQGEHHVGAGMDYGDVEDESSEDEGFMEDA